MIKHKGFKPLEGKALEFFNTCAKDEAFGILYRECIQQALNKGRGYVNKPPLARALGHGWAGALVFPRDLVHAVHDYFLDQVLKERDMVRYTLGINTQGTVTGRASFDVQDYTDPETRAFLHSFPLFQRETNMAVAPKMTISITIKENTSMKNIETITYIRGQRLDEISDDAVFSVIAKTEIKALEAIEHKPKALVDRIAALKADIDAIIAAVDSRIPALGASAPGNENALGSGRFHFQQPRRTVVSNSNQYLIETLQLRSTWVRPGVKKAIKRAINHRARHEPIELRQDTLPVSDLETNDVSVTFRNGVAIAAHFGGQDDFAAPNLGARITKSLTRAVAGPRRAAHLDRIETYLRQHRAEFGKDLALAAQDRGADPEIHNLIERVLK